MDAQRIAKPFARGATINGKNVEHWRPDPSSGIDDPLRWRKPRHVILLGDLFDLIGNSDEWIAAGFGPKR